MSDSLVIHIFIYVTIIIFHPSIDLTLHTHLISQSKNISEIHNQYISVKFVTRRLNQGQPIKFHREHFILMDWVSRFYVIEI